MGHSRVVIAVVSFLGFGYLTGLVGLIWLVHSGVDGELLAIVAAPTSGALGALGTLLASTRPTNEPQAVVVQQPANDPVPVDADP